ncbi:hypothetical protein ACFWPQ_01530 [Streptomyces sp. NPDC058464]|uniref:hypothetical protein n=1 Tax=Streptomyces sp. NPDC058464 TaxID=3346511 RepID=UPI00364916A3
MDVRASKVQKKIQLLNALIAHPRTGEAERDAGRRMLQRVISKAAAEGVKISESGYVDSRTYGAKYDHSGRLDVSDIAKLIREDIKLARKVAKKAAAPGSLAVVDPLADAPAEVKFGVTARRYAGSHRVIDIKVRNVPANWWEERTDDLGDTGKFATPALKALAAELRSIMDAYNHNGSDLLSDYTDVRFSGHVLSEEGLTLA